MPQFYSNPSRETDPHALPDAEAFKLYDGWYYSFCFPGCLPDSDDPEGPYPSLADAIAAARDSVADDEGT